MKLIRFNTYKIFIFLGIIGGSIGLTGVSLSFFPKLEQFSTFNLFFFPALGYWAKIEADLSKKSEDYKNLEVQMETQDKIHSIGITELKGLFEFLNLRIDQVLEIQGLKTTVSKDSARIDELEGFLSRKGFKRRNSDRTQQVIPTSQEYRPKRKVRRDRRKNRT
jgi:hypothetical protein